MADNTKCPHCDGTMVFNPATGKMKCDCCDTEMAIPKEEPTQASSNSSNNSDERREDRVRSNKRGGSLEQDFLSLKDEQLQDSDWGTETQSVVCDACAAEVMMQPSQEICTCPYCGSSTKVASTGGKKGLAPNGVIPFKIDEKSAAEQFTQWLGGKFFCDSTAKSTVKAGKMQGLYVPYWTFDATGLCDYTAEYGIDKKTKDANGNEKTVTDWYHTRGSFQHDFDDVLVSGTKTQNRQLLKGIEPFNDTNHPEPYRPEFLAGYSAERYSVGPKEAWEEAKAQMREILEDEAEKDVIRKRDADRAKDIEFEPEYFDITYKYLMVPVWISSYKFQDKVYNFMINGQTGKVSGDYPVSKLKVAMTILIVVAIIVGILWFLGRGH